MTFADGLQYRHLDVTQPFLRDRAAGVEVATWRRADRAGHVALQSDAPTLDLGVGDRHRRQAMEQATRGTGVDVSRTADNQLKVNVPSDVSFDTGSSALKPPMLAVLDPFAASLKDDPKALVSIIGHTDSTGSDAINNPLSVARAQAVRDHLIARGVAAARIQTEGRGEREPVADNGSEAGRAKNRRVEIFLREPAA